MAKPWALVSPSSRGIGLQLVRHLLQTTTVPIVATARTELDRAREHILTGLHDIKEERLHVVKVDVLDEAVVAEAAETVAKILPKKEHYLHLGLAIPGLLYPEKAPSHIDYDHALLTFRTNTLGPMMLLKHFSPFLPRKATKLANDVPGLPTTAVWANMSARVGSISDNRLGGWYSYRASKAAVNQLTKSFDNYLQTSAGDNALSIALHPGTVKTELSREFWDNVKDNKLFSPEFAVEKLMDVVKSRQLGDRGKCWDWKGEEIPP